MELHHDGSDLFLRFEHGLLTLFLRAVGGIRKVFVRTAPEGEEHMDEMAPRRDGWWTASVPVRVPRLAYRFWLLTEEGGWWYTAAGLQRHTPTDATDFRYLGLFQSPAWLHESVFYQIFPDRFHDGDPSSNVRDGEYLVDGKPTVARPWGEPPRRGSGSREFYGGDLEGVRQKLDYLQELGVNAIYLNPIFTAPSNHKYDVADYRNVDPHLGGNAAFESLMSEVKRRGIRLVLDIVPNHCGATHPWFTQAQQDPSAPTAAFFTFRNHPHEYESWLGVRSLPKLNYQSELLREEMIGILRHWLRPPYAIDGWRLDVANMLARQGESQLGHKIGRAIRRAVKAENPDAYLLGEHFFDGTPHLGGDELDASMNYRGFTLPTVHWLSGKDLPGWQGRPYGNAAPLATETMVRQWQTYLAAIPWQVAINQFNQLGSHDTPRIRWLLGNDDRKLEAALTLLFAFPGVPGIYYGDEVGLSGGPDPENRAPMPWDPAAWDPAILAHTRRLIALRRSSPALQRGGFQLLHAGRDRVVFRRACARQSMRVDVWRASCPAWEDLPARSGAGGEIRPEPAVGREGGHPGRAEL